MKARKQGGKARPSLPAKRSIDRPAGLCRNYHHFLRGAQQPMPSPASLFNPPFLVLAPARQTVPVVFNSPHSGCHYPDDFLRISRLEASMLRRSEDCYVDELFAAAAAA